MSAATQPSLFAGHVAPQAVADSAAMPVCTSKHSRFMATMQSLRVNRPNTGM